jgi:hypothetical protein
MQLVLPAVAGALDECTLDVKRMRAALTRLSERARAGYIAASYAGKIGRDSARIAGFE